MKNTIIIFFLFLFCKTDVLSQSFLVDKISNLNEMDVQYFCLVRKMPRKCKNKINEVYDVEAFKPITRTLVDCRKRQPVKSFTFFGGITTHKEDITILFVRLINDCVFVYLKEKDELYGISGTRIVIKNISFFEIKESLLREINTGKCILLTEENKIW